MTKVEQDGHLGPDESIKSRLLDSEVAEALFSLSKWEQSCANQNDIQLRGIRLIEKALTNMKDICAALEDGDVSKSVLLLPFAESCLSRGKECIGDDDSPAKYILMYCDGDLEVCLDDLFLEEFVKAREWLIGACQKIVSVESNYNTPDKWENYRAEN